MDQIGKVEFYSRKEFEYLFDPKVPPCFHFIYNTFLELYNGCKETITWTDIVNYSKIRKIDFKQLEIDYLLKCNSWALSKMSEMRSEE